MNVEEDLFAPFRSYLATPPSSCEKKLIRIDAIKKPQERKQSAHVCTISCQIKYYSRWAHGDVRVLCPGPGGRSVELPQSRKHPVTSVRELSESPPISIYSAEYIILLRLFDSLS